MKPADLTRLLSALQASLFFWCQSKLSPETPREGKKEEEEEEEGVSKDVVSGLVTRCECVCCVHPLVQSDSVLVLERWPHFWVGMAILIIIIRFRCWLGSFSQILVDKLDLIH